MSRKQVWSLPLIIKSGVHTNSARAGAEFLSKNELHTNNQVPPQKQHPEPLLMQSNRSPILVLLTEIFTGEPGDVKSGFSGG